MERFDQFPCKREAYPYGSGTVPRGTIPVQTGPYFVKPHCVSHSFHAKLVSHVKQANLSRKQQVMLITSV